MRLVLSLSQGWWCFLFGARARPRLGRVHGPLHPPPVRQAREVGQATGWEPRQGGSPQAPCGRATAATACTPHARRTARPLLSDLPSLSHLGTHARTPPLPPPGGGLPSPAGAALSAPRGGGAEPRERTDPSLAAPTAPRGVWDIAVDAGATRQAFQGFGTSLAWWANVVGGFPDAIRGRVLDLVFSRDKGLGFQVARFNIGGSGWATPDAPNLRPGGNVPSFLAPDGKTYDWAQDPGQTWVLLAARDRGAKTFEAFSNSPPYWMTKSGRASGGPDPKADNLAPANYTAFAAYLARVVRHFGDEYGLRFTTLDPFNEPSTDYWRAGNVQEGCHFDRDSQWAFLPVLGRALKAAGAGGVALATSDETNIADADKSFKAMTPAALKLVTQVSRRERITPLLNLS